MIPEAVVVHAGTRQSNDSATGFSRADRCSRSARTRGPTHTTEWWKVMCLTGVDYFSTLAYQPSIAFLAAGTLAPIATLVLVIADALRRAARCTSRVADMSPYGQGSILILEKLFPRWKGKALVLSPAGVCGDELRHHDHAVGGRRGGASDREPADAGMAASIRGWSRSCCCSCWAPSFSGDFRKRSGWRSCIVIAYLALNTVVLIVAAPRDRAASRACIANWRASLFAQHGNPAMMVAMALILFPEAGARAVGLRDRRGRDAAGARRRRPIPTRTRRDESATPRSCCRRRR